MTAECEFALIIITIIFCLIYSLNIPDNNQNPIFPVKGSVLISSKVIFRRNFTISSSHRSHTKIILTFLFL